MMCVCARKCVWVCVTETEGKKCRERGREKWGQRVVLAYAGLFQPCN